MDDTAARADLYGGDRLRCLPFAEHLRINIAADGQAADDLAESCSIADQRRSVVTSSNDQSGSFEPFVARTDGHEVRSLQK